MEPTLEEIDRLRERIGVKQRELCIEADVSESTLSKNRALGREPTLRVRLKLQRALAAIAEARGIILAEERTGS